MKRILILATLVLIGVSPAAWARERCYYTTLGRIRYSPYAFRFGHNGLVPDTLRYSPYAGGLVHETMRYSPYAFGFRHNGLISSIGGYYGPRMRGVQPYDMALRHQLLNAVDQLTQSVQQLQGNRHSVALRNIGQARYSRSPVRVTLPSAPARIDQRRLVSRHLEKTMPGQFRITRLLRIDSETVSFDVVLKNNSTVIKYWNPEKIKSLRAQKGRKQKVLDRYLQTWARFGNEHEMKGGVIHHISSNESEQVIAKLTTYSELEPAYRVAKR
jgi:hypothetical protein